MNQIKECILNSTLRLVTESGFQGVSISKIVSDSGVSNGGIYSSFTNRDAIFEELYLYIKKELNEIISFNVKKDHSIYIALQQYWNSRIAFGLEHPEKLKYLDLFYNSPYYSKLEPTSNYAILVEIYSNSIKTKEIIEIDTDYLLIDINSNINSVLKYLKIKPHMYSQEFINLSFRKYWRSIVNLNLY